jgi:chaperone modulatory protein CbpM
MNERSYLLTLTEVSQCIHLSVETVITIVDHGIVEPRGQRPDNWQFEPQMLAILRRATRLQQDLELDWAGIALALSLLDQLQQLRDDNRRLRHQLGALTAPGNPPGP